VKTKILVAFGALCLLLCGAASAQVRVSAQPSWRVLVQHGVDTRQTGKLQESVDALATARSAAVNEADRMEATAELGASLLQARRLAEAAVVLREAYLGAQGELKARVANDLGNLSVLEKDTAAASGFYLEAQRLGAALPEVSLSARLNLARLAPVAEKANLLMPLLPEIHQLSDASVRASYLLNFGQQALAPGGPGLAQAYSAFTEAKRAADSVKAHRKVVEALDALAQLYENQSRIDDAQTLNRNALQLAGRAPLGLVQDLLVRLEWRQSRLMNAAGQTDEALAAIQRAASFVETIRADLPIELENGRTSFSALLQPIYVSLADMILKLRQSPDMEGRKAAALAAIDALELSRQAEMQDYLGERCTVVSGAAGDQNLPQGVAVLYPLVLEDRLELLLKWGNSATHHAVKVNPNNLRRLTADMADGLRAYETDDYLIPAQQLYNLLLRPLEADLAAAQINTLIIASEGFLRPIPLAALHDGKQFLIEKYALGTVTGMSMTDLHAPDSTVVSSLMAGLSEPGPVVDKLDPSKLGAVSEVAQANTKADTQITRSRSLNLRSMRTRSLEPPVASNTVSSTPSVQRAALGEALKLPGVAVELDAISKTMQGTQLLNAEFTSARFGKEAASGSYRIVHIASHGFFGGDANSSFILAYDDVLTMNGLQSLLVSDKVKQSPIELLTLSACETAEGNERAPLGFSGAAIKARARSALGTLWPVADDAARQLMGDFYTGLTKKKSSKAAALRDAQMNLLRQPDTSHPFFWAPFTLVGNWK